MNKDNCIDYLTWTYFFRRLTKNPTFYGLKIEQNKWAEGVKKYLNGLVDTALLKL